MKHKTAAKKILIVEDEEILRDAYTKILSHEGYSVTNASDGKKALQKLKTESYDLILLDIVMPEMNGLEFLQQAKIMKINPQTKVIAFSNLSDHQKLEAMLKLGVSRNILKSSLSPKELASTVRALLT
jgi:CheY-like chemotaxis protein